MSSPPPSDGQQRNDLGDGDGADDNTPLAVRGTSSGRPIHQRRSGDYTFLQPRVIDARRCECIFSLGSAQTVNFGKSWAGPPTDKVLHPLQ